MLRPVGCQSSCSHCVDRRPLIVWPGRALHDWRWGVGPRRLHAVDNCTLVSGCLDTHQHTLDDDIADGVAWYVGVAGVTIVMMIFFSQPRSRYLTPCTTPSDGGGCSQVRVVCNLQPALRSTTMLVLVLFPPYKCTTSRCVCACRRFSRQCRSLPGQPTG